MFELTLRPDVGVAAIVRLYAAITRMNTDRPVMRQASMPLSRNARGTKLGRRLRRKAELGRAGSF